MRLRLRGAELVAFVNLCARDGIVLWAVRRSGPREATAVVRVADFRRCRGPARATGTRVHILGRTGLPFALQRLRRRPVLLLGALAVFAALATLGSYVWVVDAAGGDAATRDEVLAAAAALGLRPGTPRAAVDPARLADELPLRVPAVAWAAVTVQGVHATIRIAERVAAGRSAAASAPSDLVARADGIVQRVTVLRGTARVVPGQTVVRGQVLIAAASPDAAGARPPVASARGTVIALVWYHKTTEVGLRRAVAVETGRVAVRRRLLLFGWQLPPAWASRPLPFADYRLETRVWSPGWRGLRLPVALEALTYRQVERYWRQLTPAEAIAEGAAAAEADLRRQLPAGARPLRTSVAAALVPGERVVVTVTLEVAEDIAEPRPQP